MRLVLSQEMWIVHDQLQTPWLTNRDGSSCKGIASPKPLVIPRGAEIDIFWPEEPGILDRDYPTEEENLTYARCQVGFCNQPAQIKQGVVATLCSWHQDKLAEVPMKARTREAPQFLEPEDLDSEYVCACFCKGCGSNKHCRDHRCYPLHD